MPIITLQTPIIVSTKYYIATITIHLIKYDYFLNDPENKIQQLSSLLNFITLDGVYFIVKAVNPDKVHHTI